MVEKKTVDENLFNDQPEPVKPQESPVKESNINVTAISFFIVIITVVGLFFAISDWFVYLKIPFVQTQDLAQQYSNVNSSLLAANSGMADILELQQKDTDLDGLSDYDELYTYKTSPYLQDSDSDGFSDFTEVQNSQNPNCPAGQNCETVIIPDDSTGVSLPGLNQDSESLTEPSLDLTSAEIRSLLIEGGLSQAEVDALDDETLQLIYQESLASMQAGATADSSQSLEDSQITDIADLITPEQIRTILIQEGLEEETVNSLSDDDLYLLLQEIVKSQ